MTARRAPARTAALPFADSHDGPSHPTNHGRNGLMSYSTPDIRNVALAGHPAAGKTTLFEALLQAGGAIQTAGNIERGSTVSDFDPIERQRGHSLDVGIASIAHGAAGQQQIHITLIDTPCYPDCRAPPRPAL